MSNFHQLKDTNSQFGHQGYEMRTPGEISGNRIPFGQPTNIEQSAQPKYPTFGNAGQQPQYQSPQQGQQQNAMQNSNIYLHPMKLDSMVHNPEELFKIESRGSQLAVCPTCQKHVQTLVNYKVGTGAIASGAFVALVGGWLGCFLVPCVLEDFKDAVHYCPACGLELGQKKFLIQR